MANNIDKQLNDIEKRIENLENLTQRISLLEKTINELDQKIKNREKVQLKYPLDQESLKAIVSALEGKTDTFDLVLELIWRKMFIWETFFESLDGFEKIVSTGASITPEGGQIVFLTGNTAGNFARLYKKPYWQGVSTFFKKNGFRTTFILDSNSNVEAYFTLGENDVDHSHYGFKVVNNVLKGISNSGDGSPDAEVNLLTINSSVVYNIEARYYPKEKIVFYVNYRGSEQASIYEKPAGMITTNLPKDKRTPNRMIMDVQIKTIDGVNKTLKMSYWQFFQSREYNQ